MRCCPARRGMGIIFAMRDLFSEFPPQPQPAATCRGRGRPTDNQPFAAHRFRAPSRLARPRESRPAPRPRASCVEPEKFIQPDERCVSIEGKTPTRLLSVICRAKKIVIVDRTGSYSYPRSLTHHHHSPPPHKSLPEPSTLNTPGRALRSVRCPFSPPGVASRNAG